MKTNLFRSGSMGNILQATILSGGLLIMGTGCSKDDEGEDSLIQLQATTFTMEEVNACNHSSGSKGTRFYFETAYSNPEELDITGVMVRFKGSAGSDMKETIGISSTIDDGNSITWAGCLRFFENEWFDVEARLESADGTISNLSKVRLNKPEGAN